MPRPAVSVELFKVAARLGRNTWYASLGFGVLAVLQLWREGRTAPAAVWWTVLAVVVIARALYCQRALKRLGTDQRPTVPRTEGYATVAALEGAVWATLLVVLPATSEVGLLFQLGLTVLIVLGVLLPFAPAGLPWIAFAVPVGFAQLVALMSRELPLQELVLLTWMMIMAGGADRRWTSAHCRAICRCASVPTSRRDRRSRRMRNSIAAASNCGLRSTRSTPASPTPIF